MNKRKLVRTSINIYEDQLEWLKNHPEFNLSGWIRKEIDALMQKEVNKDEFQKHLVQKHLVVWK